MQETYCTRIFVSILLKISTIFFQAFLFYRYILAYVKYKNGYGNNHVNSVSARIKSVILIRPSSKTRKWIKIVAHVSGKDHRTIGVLGVDALHSSTDRLSDSANCVVPVTRSLALNRPNRRSLIIRGAIKKASVARTLHVGPTSRFSARISNSRQPDSFVFLSDRSFFRSMRSGFLWWMRQRAWTVA